MEELKIGQKVSATITKNGYWNDSYIGVIVGFTSSDRVKVSSRRGVKIHARKNVRLVN